MDVQLTLIAAPRNWLNALVAPNNALFPELSPPPGDCAGVP